MRHKLDLIFDLWNPHSGYVKLSPVKLLFHITSDAKFSPIIVKETYCYKKTEKIYMPFKYIALALLRHARYLHYHSENNFYTPIWSSCSIVTWENFCFQIVYRISSNKRRASNKRRTFGYPHWKRLFGWQPISATWSTWCLGWEIFMKVGIVHAQLNIRLYTYTVCNSRVGQKSENKNIPKYSGF